MDALKDLLPLHVGPSPRGKNDAPLTGKTQLSGFRALAPSEARPHDAMQLPRAEWPSGPGPSSGPAGGGP